VFGGGLLEPVDEFFAGGEVGLVAGLGGEAGQADRQHWLPDAGRVDEQHVGGVVAEPQRGQFPDEGFVNAGRAEKS
jgi:hypothetical protein